MMKKWNDLSMRERAKLIRENVLRTFNEGGSLTDISIDDIRHRYEEGGEEDVYAKANAILDERIKLKMMEDRPSYEDWINKERNKVTQAAFEYSNLRTSPSYVMLDNPYKTEEEWTSAMNSIIEERQKELNDSIRLNADQPPILRNMNVSIAQQKLDDAIWEKDLGYSSKIPANSCLTTATDNYVQVTGDKSYGANLNSYFLNNHPGYEVVPGFKDAAYGDIVLLIEDNGEAKHGMIYAGLNNLGQHIFNNSNGGPDDVAYLKGISFHSINTDKNPDDHVLILRFIGNNLWNNEKLEDYNLRYPAFMLGGTLFAEGGPEEDLNYEQNAINRATKVYDNYSEASDFDLNPINYGIRKLLGKGLSNCTLSATQWVDPNNFYKSASNIYLHPESGYTLISEEEAVPGNILIARNPDTGTFHTMLITGYDDNNKPILSYSDGRHTLEALKTNVPLNLYHAKDSELKHNHTEDLYFRYNYPNEIFLPEVTVYAQPHALGGPLYNAANPIESFNGLSKLPLVRY